MSKKNNKSTIKITIRVCNATPHRNKTILLYDDGIYGEGFVISHNMSRSNNTYHALHKNPDKFDERTAYVSHQLRKGKIGEKGLFGIKLFNDYKLCPKDEKEIMLMYKAKKDGKPWNYYIKKARHTVESGKATTTIRAKPNHIKTRIKKRQDKRIKK